MFSRIDLGNVSQKIASDLVPGEYFLAFPFGIDEPLFGLCVRSVEPEEFLILIAGQTGLEIDSRRSLRDSRVLVTQRVPQSERIVGAKFGRVPFGQNQAVILGDTLFLLAVDLGFGRPHNLVLAVNVSTYTVHSINVLENRPAVQLTEWRLVHEVQPGVELEGFRFIRPQAT